MTAIPIDGKSLSNRELRLVQTRRKQFSDATVRTQTGSTGFADTSTTFAFVTQTDSLVTGIYFTCQMKTSGAEAELNIKLEGTNLGTKYMTARSFLNLANDDASKTPFLDTNATFPLLETSETSYDQMVAMLPPFKILDGTTTFTIRLKTDNASFTAFVKNVNMDIIYTQVFNED